MRAWTEVHRKEPCTICGKTDWCARSRDGVWALCRRVDSGTGIARTDKAGGEYWLYRLDQNLTPRPLRAPVPDMPVPPCASAVIRDRVYHALLAQLPLTAAHQHALQRRGLPEPEIQRRGYRSLPPRGRAALARRLVEQFGAETCAAIPGLYVASEGRRRWWSVAGMPGLLIPVRDTHGRIVALKVRADTRANTRRYSMLSSTRHGGPGPGAAVHVPRVDAPHTGTLRLTEGELKADVATVLSGQLTLSIPGVSNWRLALPVLVDLEARGVLLAFDADWRGKPQVARSLGAVALALMPTGYEVQVEDWPLRLGKGIDDLLVSGHTPRVTSHTLALGASLRGRAKVWQGILPTIHTREVATWAQC